MQGLCRLTSPTSPLPLPHHPPPPSSAAGLIKRSIQLQDLHVHRRARQRHRAEGESERTDRAHAVSGERSAWSGSAVPTGPGTPAARTTLRVCKVTFIPVWADGMLPWGKLSVSDMSYEVLLSEHVSPTSVAETRRGVSAVILPGWLDGRDLLFVCLFSSPCEVRSQSRVAAQSVVTHLINIVGTFSRL